MAEGIDVIAARLKQGLLHIDLRRPIPEPQVKKIKIESGESKESALVKTIDLE
tara:strand:- start:710 stop:868 length:159 start_codon:yes stop_codon:yes gene_type:complete